MSLPHKKRRREKEEEGRCTLYKTQAASDCATTGRRRKHQNSNLLLPGVSHTSGRRNGGKDRQVTGFYSASLTECLLPGGGSEEGCSWLVSPWQRTLYPIITSSSTSISHASLLHQPWEKKKEKSLNLQGRRRRKKNLISGVKEEAKRATI